MFVLATGSLFKGLKIHGPFKTQEDADFYGEVNFPDSPLWESAKLTAPKEDDLMASQKPTKPMGKK